MIPYDDLVAALSAWRARQGLPVSTMGGAAPAPGSGPTAKPVSGQHAAPERLPTGDELIADDAMLEETYDSDVANYGGYADQNDGESTAIGSAPEAASRKTRDDW